MKRLLFILLCMSVFLSFTFTQTQPPGESEPPTPGPTMVGDLIWRRDFRIIDGTDPNNPPLAGVEITATALETAHATTGNSGYCTISVLAHDTGSVDITAAKEGYLTFSKTYPGLPQSGSITIELEHDPENSPAPTPSHPPYACAALNPENLAVVSYPDDLVIEVYNCGSDGQFSFYISPSWVSFPSSKAIGAGEKITVIGKINWDAIGDGDSISGQTWFGMSSGSASVDDIYYIYANYNGELPPIPTLYPTPTPGPTDLPGTGDVWIYPEVTTVGLNTPFSVEIHLNTGHYTLASYGFEISIDASMMYLEEVKKGPDGFVSAVGFGSGPDFFIITGFDATGKGPDADLHVVNMHFKTHKEECGSATINLEIADLNSVYLEKIGTQQETYSTVNISGCDTLKGDVNGDGIIDIVDALLTAQYYVEFDVAINTIAADVNCDNEVDIVDALLIAQFYVNLLDALC